MLAKHILTNSILFNSKSLAIHPLKCFFIVIAIVVVVVVVAILVVVIVVIYFQSKSINQLKQVTHSIISRRIILYI